MQRSVHNHVITLKEGYFREVNSQREMELCCWLPRSQMSSSRGPGKAVLVPAPASSPGAIFPHPVTHHSSYFCKTYRPWTKVCKREILCLLCESPVVISHFSPILISNLHLPLRPPWQGWIILRGFFVITTSNTDLGWIIEFNIASNTGHHAPKEKWRCI